MEIDLQCLFTPKSSLVTQFLYMKITIFKELQNCSNILNRLKNKRSIVILRLMMISLIVYPLIFRKQNHNAKIYLFCIYWSIFSRSSLHFLSVMSWKPILLKLDFLFSLVPLNMKEIIKLEQKWRRYLSVLTLNQQN